MLIPEMSYNYFMVSCPNLNSNKHCINFRNIAYNIITIDQTRATLNQLVKGSAYNGTAFSMYI
jgi:hypothetical protein